MHRTFLVTTNSKNSTDVKDFIIVKVSADSYEVDEGYLEFTDDEGNICATFQPSEWKWVV